MAIYHLSIKAISRSAGRSATAAAAYRAAEKIKDERTGEVHDYTHKRGVEHSELYLPGGQTADRAEFWNRLEVHHKRGDAVLAREIEVALPQELSPNQRRELAVGFARELAERYGVAADVALHAPSREGDERNHHAHLLLSACHVGSDGTLGKKAVLLDQVHCQRHQLENLAERERGRWADLCNAALEREGNEARVDHRTLLAQGIDREPGRHLGPAATGYERRRGKPSRRRQDAERPEQERPRDLEPAAVPAAPPLDIAQEQAALREEVRRRRALAQERAVQKEQERQAALREEVARRRALAKEAERPKEPASPLELAQEPAALREEVRRRRALEPELSAPKEPERQAAQRAKEEREPERPTPQAERKVKPARQEKERGPSQSPKKPRDPERER